ncbi:MAG TPA: MBL fold metallo-hydrolase [Anaerolineae bacterium]|nr:MBL fold metallo-hydrolase [Anaerolineae bacterium]HOR00098.1 MBL fold metallo-hydrolase [Anaerolineae bacterium]HPL26874.1 MBL fold metallo-hydrolase [Anaerolineae bacterium]
MATIGSSDHARLNRIGSHVYWLPPDDTTDRPILGAVVGARGTLIVDAGNSPAHANLLLCELARLGVAPPRYVALTHWHWDHVCGTSASDVPILASRETRRVVAAMAELDWSDQALERRVREGNEIEFCRSMMCAELPDRSGLVIRPPDLSFDGEVALDLGGVTCRMVHVGGDHGADCSVVYVEGDRVMFLGDCLGDDLYHGAPAYTVDRLFPLLDRLLGFGAEWYLEAHDPEPVSAQQMAEDAATLRTIGRTVQRIGRDREAILAALPALLGGPLSEDHCACVDSFLAGLDRAPDVPGSAPAWAC